MRASFWRQAALLLCVAFTAACQGAGDPVPGPSGSPSAAPSAPGEQPTASRDAPAVGPGGVPGAGGQTPGHGGAPAQAVRGDDLGTVANSCRAYLRAPRVTIEIDWQEGAELSPEARSHLLATLRAATGGVVEVTGGAEITTEREVWTTQDLRAEAAAHRSRYSTADRMALYVLSLGGRFQDEGALGVAHRASEFAVFPDRIGRLSALLGGDVAVQRAVVVHELGHLLCLLNLGYRSEHDREDPEHPGHSSDRASVMHWAIETSAVGQLFQGPPPDSFTGQDLADLEGLRSGRY